MKPIILVIALLLLSAPAWADFVIRDKSGMPMYVIEPDSKIQRMWPGGGYLEGVEIVKDQREWQHKIIPESDLESWLNQGWELVKAYTVEEEEDYLSGVTIIIRNANLHRPKVWIRVNKVIIRRTKP